MLRDINISKAAGTDILPGRFLKDGAGALTKPVTDICNLSISPNKFPIALKSAKVKFIFKKGRKLMSQITGLSPCCQYFRRPLKKLFTNKQTNF